MEEKYNKLRPSSGGKYRKIRGGIQPLFRKCLFEETYNE